MNLVEAIEARKRVRKLDLKTAGSALNKTRVVSFDLDGTITDSSFVDSVWLEGIPKAYAYKKGVSLESALREVKMQYDSVGRERLEWYDLDYWIGKFGLDVAPKQLLKSYEDRIHVFPEIGEVLSRIKERGFRLIIVSNARTEFVELEIERTRLGPYFERVFSSTSSFGLIKKSAEVFLRVCRICRISPKEMIHVGDDRVFDFQVPREIGVSTFFLDRAGQCRGRSVVHDLKEFDEKLFSLT